MPIRVTHAPIEAYAELGRQAGQAEAARRADEMSFQLAQQQMAQAHERNIMEFQAFLAEEAEKRAQAWQVEKMELAARHDFEMVEARKQAYNDQQLANQMREEQQVKQKMSALDTAAEQGIISADQAAEMKMQIRLGLSPRWMFNEDDAMTRFLKEMLPGKVDPAATQTISKPYTPESLTDVPRTVLRNVQRYWGLGKPGSQVTQEIPEHVQMGAELMKALPTLDPESRDELRNIIAAGDPTDIEQAFNKLRGGTYKSNLERSIMKAPWGM